MQKRTPSKDHSPGQEGSFALHRSYPSSALLNTLVTLTMTWLILTWSRLSYIAPFQITKSSTGWVE
jgi:hypothetical protein